MHTPYCLGHGISTINLPTPEEFAGASAATPAGVPVTFGVKPGTGEAFIIMASGVVGGGLDVLITFVGGKSIRFGHTPGAPLRVVVAAPVLNVVLTSVNDGEAAVWREPYAPQTAPSFDESGR